ncbi:BON domain-containing protein [Chitiniphilus purpureus]|uniref:BON domain-containing protein n=1 Tax=Chitiniphilus purpureus TaxID=2981137 RepID=A0ABY6DL94_9NEIS|nr:BON domain-containing protein [Chitiniphilus sp. CD1]UXY15129.1 BON domain-containing protein [Chitiniphilus sp. CD1]
MQHRKVTLALAPLLLVGLMAACSKKEEPTDMSMAASAPASELTEPTPVDNTHSDAASAVSAAGDTVASGTARAGEAIDDAALTTKVKAALAADVSLKTLTVDVDSKSGHVTLTGEVDNEAQKTSAEQVTRGVQGVGNVTNNLTVKAKG